VAAVVESCRFADCSHRVEPDCAVLAAVAAGRLDRRRLESWRALEREAAFQVRRTDARLRAAHTAELKARTRAYRARPDKRR
ncbi:MAG TPA: ribosome small subunit-dependent GTPase A, partial [Actinotalea sp.]|nr:ribosome small subunit-dependent GTPase A [Actinotalea sp.]